MTIEQAPDGRHRGGQDLKNPVKDSRPECRTQHRFRQGRKDTRRYDVRSIGELAADFACRVLEIERRFIAAGWHDPTGMNDAGYLHKLEAGQFGDPSLGGVYHYLALCAEYGDEPNIGHCIQVCKRWEIVLTADWLTHLILDTEWGMDDLDSCVADVVKLARLRERSARHHMAEAARALIDTDRYEFLLRRKCAPKRSAVPRRRQRGRVTHVG